MKDKPERIVWIYRPDNEKALRELTEKLRAEGMDVHFGHMKGVEIYDDEDG